jgi:20S proteasome subunit alpha 6
LCAPQRSANELSQHQKKLVKIDDHVGVAISGITSDARVLSKFMRTECLNSKYVFDTPLPTARLVAAVGDSMWMLGTPRSDGSGCLNCVTFGQSTEAQVTTQQYGRRPYGVGILVAGFDVCVQERSLSLLFYSLQHAR